MIDGVAYNLSYDFEKVMEWAKNYSTDSVHANYLSFNKFREDEKKLMLVEVEEYE